jgi:uncharacterized membrane protein YkvA (DUF1232 family)
MIQIRPTSEGNAMTELDERCLDAFPEWLRALGGDARSLADLVNDERSPEAVRRPIAAALNYLFKSLDLIPDGIEDLGFVDDAFVVRVASHAAVGVDPSASKDADGAVGRLAEQVGLIREFLADDYGRLEKYVTALGSTEARGRSVDDIIGDAGVRTEFVREVKAWADAYVPPAFSRDDKNLVKLRSFLSAKLPKG